MWQGMWNTSHTFTHFWNIHYQIPQRRICGGGGVKFVSAVAKSKKLKDKVTYWLSSSQIVNLGSYIINLMGPEVKLMWAAAPIIRWVSKQIDIGCGKGVQSLEQSSIHLACVVFGPSWGVMVVPVRTCLCDPCGPHDTQLQLLPAKPSLVYCSKNNKEPNKTKSILWYKFAELMQHGSQTQTSCNHAIHTMSITSQKDVHW